MLPALRIGRQPYGIVVTSDWSRWTVEPTAVSRPAIEQQLFALDADAPPGFSIARHAADRPGQRQCESVPRD